MAMSAQGLMALIDLVEIKLSCMEVWDRDDRREAAVLQHCLAELQAMSSHVAPERRGRRPIIQPQAAA